MSARWRQKSASGCRCTLVTPIGGRRALSGTRTCEPACEHPEAGIRTCPVSHIPNAIQINKTIYIFDSRTQEVPAVKLCNAMQFRSGFDSRPGPDFSYLFFYVYFFNFLIESNLWIIFSASRYQRWRRRLCCQQSDPQRLPGFRTADDVIVAFPCPVERVISG